MPLRNFFNGARNALRNAFRNGQIAQGQVAGQVEAPANINHAPLTRHQRQLRRQEQARNPLYQVLPRNTIVNCRLPRDRWVTTTILEVGVGEYRVGEDGEEGRWVQRMDVHPLPHVNKTLRSGRIY